MPTVKPPEGAASVSNVEPPEPEIKKQNTLLTMLEAQEQMFKKDPKTGTFVAVDDHANPDAPGAAVAETMAGFGKLKNVSERLVKGAMVLEQEWAVLQEAKKPSKFHPFTLWWLDLMGWWFRNGGNPEHCALSLADSKCSDSWKPVPLCWHCAGGTSYPPMTEGFDPFATKPQAAPIPDKIKVRMSSAGNCVRKVAYQIIGVAPTEKRPEHWDNAADLGSAGEAIVVQRLLDEGRQLKHTLANQKEVSIETPLVTFVGHPDGDLLRANGEWSNLEIKVLKDKLFQEVANLKSVAWQDCILYVFPDYATQTTLYMHAKGQKSTIFVFMSRDSGRRKAIGFSYDDELYKKIVLRWAEAAPAILGGKLPEPTYDGSAPACFMCQWASLCPAWKKANHVSTSGAQEGYVP